jgi:hypothetical protein
LEDRKIVHAEHQEDFFRRNLKRCWDAAQDIIGAITGDAAVGNRGKISSARNLSRGLSTIALRTASGTTNGGSRDITADPPGEEKSCRKHIFAKPFVAPAPERHAERRHDAPTLPPSLLRGDNHVGVAEDHSIMTMAQQQFGLPSIGPIIEEGANGLNDSRLLILSFRTAFISARRGSPKVERLPRALWAPLHSSLKPSNNFSIRYRCSSSLTELRFIYLCLH